MSEIITAEYLLNFGAMGVFACYLMVKDRQHTKFLESLRIVIEQNTIALTKVYESEKQTQELETVVKEEVKDLKTLRNIQERMKKNE